MMNLQLRDAAKLDAFTHMFQNMKHVCDAINIDLNPDRMYIQTMDASRISILDVTIPASWFDAYTCPTPVILGLPSSLLSRILSFRDKSQTVELVLDGHDLLRCMMTCENPGLGQFQRTYEIPLMDLDVETMAIPDIEYQADFAMPSSTFAALIQQLKTFGDSLDIQCNESTITLVAKSTDQGKMNVDIGIDTLSEFAIEDGCQLDVSFSLHQLSIIAAFSKMSKEVAIHLHKDYPLRIDYGHHEGLGLVVKYYLAPKIKDDADD